MPKALPAAFRWPRAPCPRSLSFLWALCFAFVCAGCNREQAPAKPSLAATTETAAAIDLASDAASGMVASFMDRAATGGNMWLSTHAKNLALAADPIAPGIYRADGTPFMGRGAVIHDTRGCDSCDWKMGPNPAETMRRIDILVDDWHVNFLRLVTESYSTADQGLPGTDRASWQSLLYDTNYLAALKQIVDYIGTKPGVYVYISIWRDASLSSDGMLWPTADSLTAPATLCDTTAFANVPTTTCTWRKLAQLFVNSPHVLFGVDSEPANNVDGAQDAQVWALLNAQVQAIRNVEDAAGAPHHVVLVQGTRNWARDLRYFASTQANGTPLLHPITAGGGDNVAYETHPYNPASDFATIFLDTAKYLPVVIGEFGPVYMNYTDMATLIAQAEAKHLPFIGWSFHPNCGPASMITEASGNQCDGSLVGTIAPNTWGAWLKGYIAKNLTDDPTYTQPATAPPAVSVTNLALNKATVQSSTLQPGVAGRAADGNPSGAWADGSIAHTQDRPGSTDPFWQVDLGAVHTLSAIAAYNRTDSLSDRLEGCWALISQLPFSDTKLSDLLADPNVRAVRLGKYLDGKMASATLDNVAGRYVRIMLPGANQILALAEVQVMGI